MPLELNEDLFCVCLAFYIVKVAHGEMWKEDTI